MCAKEGLQVLQVLNLLHHLQPATDYMLSLTTFHVFERSLTVKLIRLVARAPENHDQKANGSVITEPVSILGATPTANLAPCGKGNMKAYSRRNANKLCTHTKA